MPLIVEAVGSRSPLRVPVRWRGVLLALLALLALATTAIRLTAGGRSTEPPASALERDAGVIEAAVNGLQYQPNWWERITQPGRVWNDPIIVDDQTISLEDCESWVRKKTPDAAMAELTDGTPEFTPALAEEFRRRNLRSSSLAGLPLRRGVEVLTRAQVEARCRVQQGGNILILPSPTVVRFSRPAYSPDGHEAIVYWGPGDRGELLFLTWRGGGWKITGRKMFWIA